MADPAAILSEEHRVIRRLVDALRGVAQAMERGEPVEPADLRLLLDDFGGYVIDLHERRESEVLFAALREPTSQPQRTASAPRRRAHVALERLVDGVEGDGRAVQRLVEELQGLAQAASGTADDRNVHQRPAQRRLEARNRFVGAAFECCDILEHHLDTEDRRLLPAIGDVLESAELRSLGRDLSRTAGADVAQRAEETATRLLSLYKPSQAVTPGQA